MTSTLPPAAWMASTADLEKAWALTVTFLVSSPRPSTFTRPCLWTRPLARNVSGLTWSPSKSASVSRLTTTYSTRNGFLKPFSFGVRRTSGVWPPSNLGGIFPVPRVPHLVRVEENAS